MDNRDLQNQIKIEPMTLLLDILANWWVIILGAIAAGLLSYVVVSYRYVPSYSTSATFVVSSKEGKSNVVTLNSSNTTALVFESILKSNIMKKTVAEELGINLDDANISAEVISGTNMLVLTVSADNPKEAIDLIRTVMNNYTKVSFYSVGNLIMDVIAEPKVPTSPDNPMYIRNDVKKAAFIAALGLILLFGFMSYLKDTIKAEDDIEQKLDAVDLGVIPFEHKNKTLFDLFRKKKNALIVNNPLTSISFVEEYKKLATKVDYKMNKKGGKVLVVTSVCENEGKTTASVNLAVTLAQQSKKVILIDGDLRRPSLFLVFDKNPEEKQELGEFIKSKQNKVSEIMQESNVENLQLILGRNCYASSTELVHKDRMKKLIDVCRKLADYVIIDSPPAGMMGDAEALASYSDEVLLVVRQNYVLAEDINDVLDAFREHHSDVLGVVLNGARSFNGVSVGGKYYGYYRKYGNYGKGR